MRQFIKTGYLNILGKIWYICCPWSWVNTKWTRVTTATRCRTIGCIVSPWANFICHCNQIRKACALYLTHRSMRWTLTVHNVFSIVIHVSVSAVVDVAAFMTQPAMHSRCLSRASPHSRTLTTRSFINTSLNISCSALIVDFPSR